MPERKNHYSKFDFRGLLRGDSAARVAFYKGLFEMSVLTPNQIARLEDLNGYGEDGDRRYIATNNFTPLDQIGQNAQAQTNRFAALAPMIESALDAQLCREHATATKAAGKASDSKAWTSWVSEFGTGLFEHVRGVYAPIVAAIAKAKSGIVDIDAALSALCAAHINESVKDLSTSWQDGKLTLDRKEWTIRRMKSLSRQTALMGCPLLEVVQNV